MLPKFKYKSENNLIDALSISEKPFDFKMTTNMILSFYVRTIMETLINKFQQQEDILEDEETYELLKQLDQKILKAIDLLSSELRENRKDVVLTCEGVKKPN